MKKIIKTLSLCGTCLIWLRIFLIFFAKGCNGNTLNVELISLGTISPFTTTSLVLTAPAMETAVEELQRGVYSAHLEISLSLLYEKSVFNGTDVSFYSDQMMANWFYRDRSPTANLSVIILPGQ
jgi:hypothetical protein